MENVYRRRSVMENLARGEFAGCGGDRVRMRNKANWRTNSRKRREGHANGNGGARR